MQSSINIMLMCCKYKKIKRMGFTENVMLKWKQSAGIYVFIYTFTLYIYTCSHLGLWIIKMNRTLLFLYMRQISQYHKQIKQHISTRLYNTRWNRKISQILLSLCFFMLFLR